MKLSHKHSMRRTLTYKKPFVDLPFSAQAVVSRTSLLHNYNVLMQQAPEQWILPMIKANGYGHDATWVAKSLLLEKNLFGFGVATFEEAMKLRQELKNKKIRIYVFSDTAPWIEQMGQICERYYLTPILYRFEDFERLINQGYARRIAYEIKFNTGMNRLGVEPSDLQRMIKKIKSLKLNEYPSGMLSHLAQAEDPKSALTQKQIKLFCSIHADLRGYLSADAQVHLLGSAGIWNAKHYGLNAITTLVRPGLSLYGVRPWAQAPSRQLLSVLTFKSRVVQMRTLKPGDQVGYGGTFTFKSSSTLFSKMAIVRAGYADGLLRRLSSRGKVELPSGKVVSILGRISMDLVAIEASEDLRVGDEVVLFGGGIDPWVQAHAADTVPYEILTSLSARVHRKELES